MDARIIWDHWGGDLAIISGDVLLTDGLETAVILSLFLDARARDDDPLPDGGTDRRGWWADDASPMTDGDRTVSRLWLLSREKTLPEVLRRAHDYAFEALIWLVDDGIARAVDVDATMPRPGLLALAVKIFLPDDQDRNFTYKMELGHAF